MDAMDPASPPLSQMQGRESGTAADREAAAAGDRGAVAAAAGQGEAALMPEPRVGWTSDRIARLAYLVGLGKSASEISFDAVVQATPNAIYKVMGRLNLRFRDVPHTMLVSLSNVETAALDAEAARRGMTADALAARVIRNCIEDKLYGALIDV